MKNINAIKGPSMFMWEMQETGKKWNTAHCQVPSLIWINLSVCVWSQEDREQGKPEDMRDARRIIDEDN